MTVQAKDKIIIEDMEYPMSSTPFNVYLKSNNLAIKRKRLTTGNYRGYIGKWQIIGKDLFLVGLSKDPEDDQPLSVNTFFPGEDRVVADWYTGMLEVKTGKEVGYCHFRGELSDILSTGVTRGYSIETTPWFLWWYPGPRPLTLRSGHSSAGD